ncbi:ATP-dependent DNA ligase [Bacillus sp. 31A1R]|uniref:ATP-dependent DNA ligase n=1 Tax=Robertmurraya mangrovi TaxID=3098077 RepID=A0ABU5ITF4_9BACI|nr:ATP-dependent DNA ligase [Bacillus sp. 31A1R]MDZ5470413.1 ATP-dependent DNA ligase [Bacillus sp. 31A1R]
MFISPMLLQKSDHPLDDYNYITELKADGFRCIWTKFNNKVRIYTRHNNEITAMFPELQNIPIPDRTVLDGEIIVTDNEGKPDFEAVMERFKSKKSVHEITFFVFDILYHKGGKVTDKPLVDRKELLGKVIPEDSTLLTKVKWIEGNAISYFGLVKQNGLEGIVMKRADSKYAISKRSHEWLKVINYKYTNVVISGMRKDEFGLLLCSEDNGKIKPVGVMEFMPQKDRMKFYQQYQDLIVDEDKKFIYIEPKLKCKVKFRNYTKARLLRIPSFVEFIS